MNGRWLMTMTLVASLAGLAATPATATEDDRYEGRRDYYRGDRWGGDDCPHWRDDDRYRGRMWRYEERDHAPRWDRGHHWRDREGYRRDEDRDGESYRERYRRHHGGRDFDWRGDEGRRDRRGDDGPRIGRGDRMPDRERSERAPMPRAQGGGGIAALDSSELDQIKRELAITPQQEQAWSKYAAAVQAVAANAKSRISGMDGGAMRSQSAEEHRKLRDTMLEQRRRDQDAIRAAADELVQSFDEKQIAVAKEVLPGFALRGGFGMGMMPSLRGPGMGGGMMGRGMDGGMMGRGMDGGSR